jgi:hypothetical protein
VQRLRHTALQEEAQGGAGEVEQQQQQHVQAHKEGGGVRPL